MLVKQLHSKSLAQRPKHLSTAQAVVDHGQTQPHTASTYHPQSAQQRNVYPSEQSDDVKARALWRITLGDMLQEH